MWDSMKKTVLSIFIFIFGLCLCCFFLLLPTRAFAVGSYGVNENSVAYTTSNPFYPTYENECTWYCWGRALEKCGIALPIRGNAKDWYNNALAAGLSADTTPASNSIVVFRGDGTGNSAYGHVAFVEYFDGITVYISEGNRYDSNLWGRYYEDSFSASYPVRNPNNPTWQETVIGYIHLSSNKIQLWSVDSSTVYSGTVKFWAKRNDDDSNHYAVFYIDDVPITDHLSADQDGFFSVDVDTTTYENGAHQLSIHYVNSSSDEWSVCNVNFYNDLYSNIIQLWSVDSSTVYSGTVKFWAKRNDDDSNHYAVFYIDDVPITDHLSADQDGFFSVDVDTTTYENGAHQLSIHYVNSSSDEWSVCNVNFYNDLSGEPCGENVQWKLQDGILSIWGNGAITSHPWDTDEVQSIIISPGTTSICDNAFSNCTNLTSVSIPQTVSFIGNRAFSGCENLSELTIPASVSAIKNATFQGCSNLLHVNISEGLTSIESWAFDGCSKLQSVYIPSTMNTIEDYVFGGCTSLNTVYISSLDSWKTVSLPTKWGSFWACPHKLIVGNQEVTEIVIPEGTETVSQAYYSHCSSIRRVVLPETVTTIDVYAFSFCINLESINMPSGLLSIKSWAFEGCSSLNGINIPDTVTYLGDSVFKGCSNICTINIPNGLTEIPYEFLCNCIGLNTVTIPASILSIRSGAFYGCEQLEAVELPANLNTIGSYAFRGSGLTTIEIPNNVVKINSLTFANCSQLSSVTIPSSVTEIEEGAFSYCDNLKALTIPGSVKEINNCFFCSGLQSVTLSEGTETIDYSAFRGCRSLTSVTLPRSMLRIKNFAFEQCDELKDVYYKGTEEDWGEIIIEDDIGSYWYPFKNAAIHFEGEDGYVIDIVLPSSLTSIEDEAFAGIKNVVIYVPRTVHYISSTAFDSSVVIVCPEDSDAEKICLSYGLTVITE